ncbi:MAG: 2-hydroxyacid dehydrogenase [Pseudorhodoplanes sp.]|uniref:2-hydroxyacid dehydrogenase n=1 Tax=Pseudorhodoplanes sp. TaxID=1934341 RepID=UPI003D0AC5E0
MRPRVYVTQPIAESALFRLKEIAEVEVNHDSSRILATPKLIEAAKRADIILCLLHDTIDRDVLAANPNLKAIASMTITPDRIDVDEATTRRIIVTNIPAVVTDATADLAFGLMLAVARRIVEGDKVVRSGVFPGSQSNHLAGVAVSGKVLGLVGIGRIGQAMARRARGFDMTVLYSDPRGLSGDEERALGVTPANFEELLGQADFISLHPALNDETHHMMGARQFALMKRSAFLINTSRGPIVDEKALAQALADGRIAGAGIDVYEHEPKIERALLTMNNVVLTPHLGSAVMELRERMAHVVVDNIAAIAEGRLPPNCINPSIFAPGA